MTPSKLLLPILLFGCALLAAAPLYSSLEPRLALSAGITLLAVVLWSTAAIPEYLTTIILFFLTVILALAPPEVVFSGFQSGATWLVFGGFVIGLAVQKSGLGARVVESSLARLRGGYAGIIIAIAAVGMLLSFFIPSAMGRVMLLLPIVIAFADRLGFEPGTNGRMGLVMAVGFCTTVPAFAVLPSNVPNVAMAGAAESLLGITFRYGEYFLLNFPVLGLVSLIAGPVLILSFFPARLDGDVAAAARAPWSRRELTLLIVVLATVGLWATDFLHHIAPAWIAMGAAIVCLLPGVGVVDARDIKEINWGAWIFVAGVIALGAIAKATGLGDAVAEWLFSVIDLSGSSGMTAYFGVLSIGMVVSLLTSHPAAPAVMTPLAPGLAGMTGWPVEGVLLAQIPAWIVFFLPYQAPPLLISLTVGGVRLSRALPLMAVYFIFGIIVMLPLHYYWGRFLGYWP